MLYILRIKAIETFLLSPSLYLSVPRLLPLQYLTKKPDKVDPNEARLSCFTCCALSGEPLAVPAVVDRLGNLYNKEPLVEALLHKRLPKALSHIRGLRDMIPIHLHPKPDVDTAGEEVRFQCPITGLEFNRKY